MLTETGRLKLILKYWLPQRVDSGQLEFSQEGMKMNWVILGMLLPEVGNHSVFISVPRPRSRLSGLEPRDWSEPGVVTL